MQKSGTFLVVFFLRGCGTSKYQNWGFCLYEDGGFRRFWYILVLLRFLSWGYAELLDEDLERFFWGFGVEFWILEFSGFHEYLGFCLELYMRRPLSNLNNT